jgi:hypothetical protein
MFTPARHFSEWVRKRRAVTREEYARVADWVSEGGALDPAGPPPLLEEAEVNNRRAVTRSRPSPG